MDNTWHNWVRLLDACQTQSVHLLIHYFFDIIQNTGWLIRNVPNFAMLNNKIQTERSNIFNEQS